MDTLPAPLLLAFVALLAAAAGAGAGVAWAIVRADRRPQRNLDTELARLETERAKEKLDNLELLEKMAGVADATARHRARIDGAEGAKRKREQREAEEQPELPVDELAAVRARARQRGLL